MSDVDVKGEYAGLVKAAATGDRAAMERLLVRAQEVAYRFSLLVWPTKADTENMENALTFIAVLALWWVLQVWLFPRLGVPT